MNDEPEVTGLTMPELMVALEIWQPGSEPYVCFVNRKDCRDMANRLAHPALHLRSTDKVPQGQVFVWLLADAPEGLMKMSEKVRTYRRRRG